MNKEERFYIFVMSVGLFLVISANTIATGNLFTNIEESVWVAVGAISISASLNAMLKRR
ncbi:MAG: hypothetical protein WCW93_01270 [Candidatus Paceibacterota bacterium]